MKIGIDLGGSHIAVGIITNDGEIIVRKEEDINLLINENMNKLIRDKILSLISCILEHESISIEEITEIGIGIPGIIENNLIVKCEKYGINNWNLAEELFSEYKIPIKIQNDAICAAKAEYKYGNLKNVKKAVFLCLGTGIGGVNILNSEIYSAEYGHMVIQKEGKECYCGRKGCFETYSSMKAFKEGMRNILNISSATTSEQLLEILNKQQNNVKLNEYINEYIDTLLIGIINIVNITNPEKICIGGSFSYFEKFLLNNLLNKIKNVKCQFNIPKIEVAKLKNEAGIIGAVL